MSDKKAAPTEAATAAAPTAAAPTAAAPTAAARAAVLAANKLGNECYSKSEYHEAIQHYSSAIGLNGNDNMLYYNRSQAYEKINAWKCAIADVRKVSIAST